MTAGYELIDLAQEVIDGKKDGSAGKVIITSGGNRTGEMMAGLQPASCALLWALVRSTSNTDRHFGLLHLMLTNHMRLEIANSGAKFTKQSVKEVAAGVARSAAHQYLFKKGHCKNCNGKGRVFSGMCSACGGSSFARWNGSDGYRLSKLAISRQAYTSSCMRFEDIATDTLHTWRVWLDAHLFDYFNNAFKDELEFS